MTSLGFFYEPNKPGISRAKICAANDLNGIDLQFGSNVHFKILSQKTYLIKVLNPLMTSHFTFPHVTLRHKAKYCNGVLF